MRQLHSYVIKYAHVTHIPNYGYKQLFWHFVLIQSKVIHTDNCTRCLNKDFFVNLAFKPNFNLSSSVFSYWIVFGFNAVSLLYSQCICCWYFFVDFPSHSAVCLPQAGYLWNNCEISTYSAEVFRNKTKFGIFQYRIELKLIITSWNVEQVGCLSYCFNANNQTIVCVYSFVCCGFTIRISLSSKCLKCPNYRD